MAETTFMQEGSYTVTNARFITPSATYAMAGIQSVKTMIEKPDSLKKYGALIAGIFIGLVGLVHLFTGKFSYALGFAVAALALIAYYVNAKTQYYVVLNSANGEVSAVSSPEKDFIDKIYSALNEAIIHRG
jgi:hypothetical protein